MRIKLTPNKETIELESEGGVTNYELREMSAADRDQYLDRFQDRMERRPDGSTGGMKKIEGAQADLLSRTLFDSNGNKVSATTIQSWPSTSVTALFLRAQALNRLTEDLPKVVEEAKNASEVDANAGSK